MQTIHHPWLHQMDEKARWTPSRDSHKAEHRCETTTAIWKFWQDAWKEEPLEGCCLGKAREHLVEPTERWQTGTRRETWSGSCQPRRLGERHTRARQGQEAQTGGQEVSSERCQTESSHCTQESQNDGWRRVARRRSCRIRDRPACKHVQAVGWRLFESAQIQSNSLKKWSENIGVGHFVAYRLQHKLQQRGERMRRSWEPWTSAKHPTI